MRENKKSGSGAEPSVNLRFLALETLLEWEKSGGKLGELVGAVLEKYAGLPKNQRAFYTRLTEGTVEQKIRLDDILNRFSKTPAEKMKPAIRNILRLSLYQLMFMDAVPDAAVVNEAVKLARKKGFGTLSGFVNGILRAVIRDPQKAEQLPEEPLRRISVEYSMPLFLAEQWEKEYGETMTEAICAAFLEQRPVMVRVRGKDAYSRKNCLIREADRTAEGNAVLPTTQDILDSLTAEGASAKPSPYLPFAFRISAYDRLPALTAFREGRITVQDVSSMLTVCAAGLQKDRAYRILDVCAAPGGKSLLAADLAGAGSEILARDISAEKLTRIEENCTRLGIRNIRTQLWDAREFDPSLAQTMDVVFADVPCSGYGVIGKKPDIKYNASRENQEALAALQAEILECAARCVKPGGVLIYSTCTISKAENEDNVRRFLEKQTFAPEDLTAFLPQPQAAPSEDGPAHECAGAEKEKKRAGLFSARQRDDAKQGFLQLLPDQDCDGFFFARLVRKAE